MRCSIRLFLCLVLLVPSASVASAQNARKSSTSADALRTMEEVFYIVNDMYVDTADMVRESEEAINAMLRALDPHSAFIPAREVENANAALTGKIIGIGISFRVIQDTIRVEEVINEGPSERAGLMNGDNIVAINGKNCTGDSITNTFARSSLRGEKGSKVAITVRRYGYSYPLNFTITRGEVPLKSVDNCFMVNDSIAYLRLTRFAATSHDELVDGLRQLKRQGAISYIIDLRNNSGGYLDAAYEITKEFLPAKRLVFYTQGDKVKRQNLVTTEDGEFTHGMVVLLVNENSASASEIMSGALQDWDRAILIGRRTYGKGLVQRLYNLSDGSQLRLTTSRYYTPSGRCIQKSYANGINEYQKELETRNLHGEYYSKDSISFPDSLKYLTSKGRVVYGGGGIMPDLFVPLDTTQLSELYTNVRARGLIESYAIEFANRHRAEWSKRPKKEFIRYYAKIGGDSLFRDYARQRGLYRKHDGDTLTMSVDAKGDTTHYFPCDDFSCNYIFDVVEATVVSELYGTAAYYEMMMHYDTCLQTAIKYLEIDRRAVMRKNMSEATFQKTYLND